MRGRGLGGTVGVVCLWVVAAVAAAAAAAGTGGGTGDGSAAAHAVDGAIDLSEHSFAGRRPVALDGEWWWVPGRLLDPAEAAAEGATAPGGEAGHVGIPKSLRPARSQGVGTLVLRATLPDAERSYALKIPYMSSAHRVFVDAEELGGSGSVENPYRAQYMPQELFFESADPTITLTIQVANRHHRRMRLTRVYLGSAQQVRRMTHMRIIRDALLFGSLALLAVYHLVVFFLHQRDRAFLFFAGVSGVAAMRLGVTTERILVRVWPAMPPELMMKLGYAPAFLLLPLIVLYVHQLSPYDTLRGTARVSRVAGGAFALMILATTVRVYDWVFEYGIIPILLFGAYTLYRVFRYPTFDSHRGAVVIATGGVIILGTAVSDYLREIGVLPVAELLSVGILAFLLLQAYFLAWRFRTAYRDTSNLAAEVQRLNRDLEFRISERTQELAEANDRLERISRTDGLTGIANRRYFDEHYEREWEHAVRNGTSIAAILADIDYFKAYNDHRGHLEGDACLRRIAGVLELGARRRIDLVARYGGEEFMVLLPDARLETAERVAEDLRARIEALGVPHPAAPSGPVVTVSFGVAALEPGDDDAPETLLRQADRALYQAKALGRNRVVSGAAV